MKHFLPIYALAAFALTGNLALADDTEIYLSTNTEIGGDYAKPNILFVMDTSGSMGDNIAIEIPPDTDSPFYDPDTDYGDSDDSLIYVYDTDFVYQGITITRDQNVCDAMTNHFIDNPNFPSFEDQAYQWQTETTTQTIIETVLECVDVSGGGGDPVTVNESGRVNNSVFDSDDYGPYPVEEGQNFVASVTISGRNDEARLYVKFGSSPSVFSYDCRRTNLRNETGTCDLTVPNGETQAYVSVTGNDFTFNNGGNNSYDLEVTYSGSSTTEVCEPVTTTTDIEVTEANWSDNLETNASDAWVLECQNDAPDWVRTGRNSGYYAGGHGIDDDSDDRWIRNCGSNDCLAPRYSDDEDDEISWRNVETRSFLPANYHDYIQSFGPPEDSGSYPDGNMSSTCNSAAEGYEFIDDGVVYRCTEKRDLMQDSTVNLINSLVGVNLGLARFNGGDGGYILEDIKDVDIPANKTSLINTVNAIPASGSTPLAETLWEAMRYYRGNSQDYGNNSGANTDPDALRGLEDLVNPTYYSSPIENACQVNNIIYLTDGEPTSDSGRDSEISSLTGNSCSSSSYGTDANDTCLDELAGYMNTHDMASGITGTQTVRTYTIGFDIDLELLNATAEKGGGEYFTVSNAFQLSSAFSNILVDVLSDSATFVAPAVSVNAFNQLQNRNELYYAVFRPDNSPRWNGNIKKYRISSDGTVTDVNGNDAIDSNTGYFADNAQSYWAPDIDGKTVELGGIASQMPDDRNVYTYIGSNPSNVSLATGNVNYQVSTSNSLITNELLGLDSGATSSQRNNLILWGAGYDLTDDDSDGLTNDANMFVADPLHSRPVVITYGGTEENPDDLLIASTNMGYIHAVNPSTGIEQWSFIPGDLLDNLRVYRDGNTEEAKAYGLDGELTTWYKESLLDSDQDIEAGDGDFVKIYLGMRRGGRDYYAMDITNKTSPKIMWKINGGSGVFNDLGQSWSKMVMSKVAWDCDTDGTNCGVRDVLFFSGGYDTRHDTETDITTGDLGNAIYMVDANTGDLIWSAGNNSDGRTVRTHSLNLDMENSFPASPEVIDVDADGLVDILYAVDIAGHVWRIDMNPETESASDFATGGEIFDLTASGNFRRFYNQPDLVLTAERGQPAHINIIFGSGYRAHPRDTAQNDNIYVLFDDNVFSPPTNGDGDITYTTINGSSLYSSSGGDIVDKSVNAPYGYYVSLTGNGEKILGSSVTIQNRVIISSYMPQGVTAAGSCSGGQLGSGRTYVLNLTTGENEYIELKQEGIPAEAAVIAVPDTVVCVGTECFAEDDLHDELPEAISDLLAPALQGYTGAKRTYWREESTQ